jgi:hypothetical protein
LTPTLWIWLAACDTSQPKTQPANPETIVLVVVDTLRRDRVGVYGYERETTPRLNSWSANAAVYTQARAPSSWTVPSVRSLFAADQIDRFEPRNTLATRLQEAGWHTAAYLANPNAYLAIGQHGWDQSELTEGAAAGQLVQQAIGDLEGAGERQFIYLHLMDTHLPYTETSPALGKWAPDVAPTQRVATTGEPQLHEALAQGPALTAVEQEYLSARYDQNVWAMDQAVGSLLEQLGPKPLVVFTSDHGEELGDRGWIGHGHQLTEELVRIPLIVSGPGWVPRREDSPVGLDDVGATVLAAAGLSPSASASGRDLAILPPETPRAQPLSHTHYGPARLGVVNGATKWTATVEQVSEVDLASDPYERSPTTVPWHPKHRNAWQSATGHALHRVFYTRLGETSPYRANIAPPQARGVTLRHNGGAGFAQAWWPPRPLETPPKTTSENTGITVFSDGPYPIPGELYVAAGEMRNANGLQVSVDSSDPPMRTHTGIGWAPGPAPHIPLVIAPVRKQLESLGYVERTP